jgi:hypothetical protein
MNMDEDDLVFGDFPPPVTRINFYHILERWDILPPQLGKIIETGLLRPVVQDPSKLSVLARVLNWLGDDCGSFRDILFELADVQQLERTHPEVILGFLDDVLDQKRRPSRPESSFNVVLMSALDLMARWRLNVEQLFALVGEKGVPAVDCHGQPIQLNPPPLLNPVLMSFRLGDVLLFEQAYPELKEGSVETVPSTNELHRSKVTQETAHSTRPAALHKEMVIKIARELKRKHPNWDCNKIIKHDRIQSVTKKTTEKPYSDRKYLEWCREALKSSDSSAAE